MKKIVPIILLVSLLVCSLTSCIFQDDLAHITGNWVPERDDNVAILLDNDNAIILYGELYYIVPILTAYYDGIFGEDANYYAGITTSCHIVCVKEYDVYGVCQLYDGWDLYKINLNTQKLQILYSTRNLQEFGKDPMAYADGGLIYIYDDVRTVTYDINQKSIKEMPGEAFGMPYTIVLRRYIVPNTKYKTFWLAEEQIFEIKNEQTGEIRQITYDYVADRCKYMEQIREYGENMNILIPELTYRPDELFYVSLMHINENFIYLGVNICDKEGDETLVYYRYNFVTEEFVFLYSEFCGNLSLIVPVYK